MNPELSVAETLPRVYRNALDAIGELERRGLRAEAARFRRLATAAYSAAWDETSKRRLEQVVQRVHSMTADIERRDRSRRR